MGANVVGQDGDETEGDETEEDEEDVQPKYGSFSLSHRETEKGTTDLSSVQLSKTRNSSQPPLTETRDKTITE